MNKRDSDKVQKGLFEYNYNLQSNKLIEKHKEYITYYQRVILITST